MMEIGIYIMSLFRIESMNHGKGLFQRSLAMIAAWKIISLEAQEAKMSLDICTELY